MPSNPDSVTGTPVHFAISVAQLSPIRMHSCSKTQKTIRNKCHSIEFQWKIKSFLYNKYLRREALVLHRCRRKKATLQHTNPRSFNKAIIYVSPNSNIP